MQCVICGKISRLDFGITCSSACHEELVRRVENKLGKFKKIVRLRTGEEFKVPVRDLIEKGVSERDLDKYPKWEE